MLLCLRNSTTLERTLVNKLLRNEKAMHLIANPVPHAVLAEFVITWKGNSLHEPPVRLRARGFLEDVERSPIDKLRPATPMD